MANAQRPALGRFAVFLLLFAAFALAPAWAATRIDLDAGWQFRTDSGDQGLAQGWQRAAPGGLGEVTLPHTWNLRPGQDYLGPAWYFRTLERPPLEHGARVELHFGATFYTARVWLNGEEIGAHEGGFTAWSLDLTPHLRAANLLAVRLDNRPGPATIPGLAQAGTPDARYDWWTYGGIVRDVWLEVSGPARVVRQAIAYRLSDSAAELTDRVIVQNGDGTRAKQLRLTAFDPDGRPAATALQALAPGRGEQDVRATLHIDHPRRWGLDTPDLYRLHAELLDAGARTLDTHDASTGLRSIEIRDRHLLINGERVRLTGMARHEDSPWEGLAETRGTLLHDLDDMKALHTTLSRPVHYPQPPALLDYADRHGILLVPEIPVWQFSEAQLADARVQDLAKRQVREMIEEAGNHPSIFAWSVANESATGTAGGIAYFRALRDWVHRLDPARYVTFADDKLPRLARAQDSAAYDADFLLMNQYYGSWHGKAEDLPAALDRVDALFPDKMVIISEMGYAGIFAGSPAAADPARVKILREQLPLLAARDWIAGAILWCYQDYRSPRNLWPGLTDGYVEHGLVDEYRQRKPSYSVWQDLTAPAHLQVQWQRDPAGRHVGIDFAVQPNGPASLPFRALRSRSLEWKLLAADGKVLREGTRHLDLVQDPLTERVSLASGDEAARRVQVRLVDADGLADAQATLEVDTP